MDKKHFGYAFFEILIVISIITMLATFAFKNFQKLFNRYHAITTIHSLQQAIDLARSLAILNKNSVDLCPSFDGSNCTNNWGYGILILCSQGKRNFIKMNFSRFAHLQLSQNGKNCNKITIHADGMTYTNGHFTFKISKSSASSQFKLYFNRALRTYVVADD